MRVATTKVAKGKAAIGETLYAVEGPKSWTKDHLPVFVATARIPVWKADEVTTDELVDAVVIIDQKGLEKK